MITVEIHGATLERRHMPPSSARMDVPEPKAGSVVGWERVMYRRQPFPDNFVDPTFLDSLVTNRHVRPTDYWTLVSYTPALTQQVSTVVLVAVVFSLLLSGRLSVAGLVAMDIALLLSLVLVRQLAADLSSLRRAAEGLAAGTLHFGVCAAILLVVSPVLRTLTESYSSDTVWALSAGCAAVHLSLFDYKFASTVSTRLNCTVSLNASVVLALLLASRLPSSPHVAAFLLLAILLFVLQPRAWHELGRSRPIVHAGATACVCISTAVALWWFAPVACIVYVMFVVFVTLVCPVALQALQHHKLEMEGPWDIAYVATTDGFLSR